MEKPSRRELVTKALLAGREQKKDYLKSDGDKTVHGTVSVILKDQKFLISIQEIKRPSNVFFLEKGWDVDELHTVPNLENVEELLLLRLGLFLNDLGPAKGIRRF